MKRPPWEQGGHQSVEKVWLLPICEKVLVHLFQKVADSKGGAFGRPPQRAKFPYGPFLFVSFFFWAFSAKEKAGEKLLLCISLLYHNSFLDKLCPPWEQGGRIFEFYSGLFSSGFGDVSGKSDSESFPLSHSSGACFASTYVHDGGAQRLSMLH